MYRNHKIPHVTSRSFGVMIKYSSIDLRFTIVEKGQKNNAFGARPKGKVGRLVISNYPAPSWFDSQPIHSNN